ncbi:MAG: chemotaxis protein [gamma proteobacterium symbiont of Taylorina sp.]|nr:chemotaxis protein [gamma proteobacterium symbiont of Taylorina sp.]
MANFIQSVDERTNLAGTNRLEVLLFSLGKDDSTDRQEVYGINVFKVREVMQVPAITHAPDMPPSVEGMTSLRGTMVPVVNLPKFCGLNISEEPQILIVTEYNKHMQGFLVQSVENILRLQWNDIKVPPQMMSDRLGGLVTAVTELQDGRIAMIMDVEKVLAETAHFAQDESFFDEVTNSLEDQGFTVMFADDSTVARNQIERTLDHMGVAHISAINGAEAWNKLKDIASRAETTGLPVSDYIQLILTDVEMPEMDGYVLTKHIKNDPRFKDIPVVMHSSLSAEANKSLGKGVGADDYVAKFEPVELSNKLVEMLAHKKPALEDKS